MKEVTRQRVLKVEKKVENVQTLVKPSVAKNFCRFQLVVL